MKISKIIARQILDSRGNPTVEADVVLDSGSFGRASVPSGVSTGSHEVIELRDNNPNYFGGKSVINAVENINREISEKLIGMDASNQYLVDHTMMELDGTKNKSRLGANAILAVSIAVMKAVAQEKGIQLFEYIRDISNLEFKYKMPLPMVNVINGGRHAKGSTDIQEFMIVPVGAKSFSGAVEMCANVFHNLAKILENKGYFTTVGDEGGYAPNVTGGNSEALDLIMEAIRFSGYKPHEDIALALDVAASELYENDYYNLKTENKKLSEDEIIDWYKTLIVEYPIISIEDGLAEDAWNGWSKLTKILGNNIMIVGDDLFVTNNEFLKRGIEEKSANTILIKINQIGTITETIDAVKIAKASGFNSIISHRSGETEDTTIAHLSVGLSTGLIKSGSMSRTDRVAKYNELLRIEEYLGDKAEFN